MRKEATIMAASNPTDSPSGYNPIVGKVGYSSSWLKPRLTTGMPAIAKVTFRGKNNAEVKTGHKQ
jgi:hypothetical protein